MRFLLRRKDKKKYENINVLSSPDSSGIPRFWAWIQRMAGGIVNEKIKRVLQKKKQATK